MHWQALHKGTLRRLHMDLLCLLRPQRHYRPVRLVIAHTHQNRLCAAATSCWLLAGHSAVPEALADAPMSTIEHQLLECCDRAIALCDAATLRSTLEVLCKNLVPTSDDHLHYRVEQLILAGFHSQLLDDESVGKCLSQLSVFRFETRARFAAGKRCPLFVGCDSRSSIWPAFGKGSSFALESLTACFESGDHRNPRQSSFEGPRDAQIGETLLLDLTPPLPLQAGSFTLRIDARIVVIGELSGRPIRAIAHLAEEDPIEVLPETAAVMLNQDLIPGSVWVECLHVWTEANQSTLRLRLNTSNLRQSMVAMVYVREPQHEIVLGRLIIDPQRWTPMPLSHAFVLRGASLSGAAAEVVLRADTAFAEERTLVESLPMEEIVFDDVMVDRSETGLVRCVSGGQMAAPLQ